jgi:hypothetical protein
VDLIVEASDNRVTVYRCPLLLVEMVHGVLSNPGLDFVGISHAY